MWPRSLAAPTRKDVTANEKALLDGMALSAKWLKEDFIDFHECVCDGFYDVGRHHTDLPELHDARSLRLPWNREVILIDQSRDAKLRAFMAHCKEMVTGVIDEIAQAKILSLLVACRLGGCGPSVPALVDNHVVELKRRSNSPVLHIGVLEFGVCRHRAILFKMACDEVGILCRLIRGNILEGGRCVPHAWNVVKINGVHLLADVMHDPGCVFEEMHSRVVPRRYTRIKQDSRTGVVVAAGRLGMLSLAPWQITQESEHSRDVHAPHPTDVPNPTTPNCNDPSGIFQHRRSSRWQSPQHGAPAAAIDDVVVVVPGGVSRVTPASSALIPPLYLAPAAPPSTSVPTADLTPIEVELMEAELQNMREVIAALERINAVP